MDQTHVQPKSRSSSEEKSIQPDSDPNSPSIHTPDAPNQSKPGDDEPASKKRRIKNPPEQKHKCNAPDCDKSFTRLEHLYRHQLNHNPKQIYKCRYPDCKRDFVREDLRERHEKRHDNNKVNTKLTHSRTPSRRLSSEASKTPSTDMGKRKRPSEPTQKSPVRQVPSRPSISTSTIDTGPKPRPASASESSNGLPSIMSVHQTSNAASRRESGSTKVSDHVSPSTTDQYRAVTMSQGYSTPAYQNATYAPIQRPSLSSPGWSDAQSNGLPTRSSPQVNENMPYENPSIRDPQPDLTSPNFSMDPTSSSSYTGYDAQLFDFLFPNSEDLQNPNPLASFNGGHGFSDLTDVWSTYMAENLGTGDEIIPFERHPMSINSLIKDPKTHSSHALSEKERYELIKNPPHSLGNALSEKKRQELIKIIEQDFIERDRDPLPRRKQDLLRGNQAKTTHVLSLGMMQIYLHQFWTHFDPQVPILHKPTFAPDEASPLLLIAMMILGASCMPRDLVSHDHTTACAQLADFLAFHLRIALFRDADFQPPAKLWVFQALILLEFHEKCYSISRSHHETAHIHHGTALNLMKRGPFLAGKPLNGKSASNAADKASNRASKLNQDGEEWWERWVIKESTRRVVLAAFVMDAVHQKLFGHEMVLNIHEMKLPLPCDECYWTASSVQELRANIPQDANANSIKAPSFLDSLKRTLNGQQVQTNTFGRMVLMAGLLNVSFHMSGRDELVSNLGVSAHPKGPQREEKWKTSLKRAFNFWKRDFDVSLAQTGQFSGSPTTPYVFDKGNVFESRTVMHHLAFMSIHADIVDIQIFAGAQSMLGRPVTQKAKEVASQRVKEVWAPSAGAREAVYHALKFLAEVLLSEENGTESADHGSQPQPPGDDSDLNPRLKYSAREDPLLNRPWVLYHAALIVWSYGYALDGPVSPNLKISMLSKARDMRRYLKRMSNLEEADDLEDARKRNSCVGLLMTLRDLFQDARWELLREASSLLTECIDLLVPEKQTA